MKNKILKIMIFIFVISIIFYTVHTFAIFRKSGNGTGTFTAATWSVTRNYSEAGDSIDVTPGGTTDTYTLTVESHSEVDVIYKIIISNLPNGVEVDIDNTGFQTPTGGSLTIQNANTIINYNDATKTKTHTLTFRATSSAQIVSNQEIDIDVEFKQDV